MKKQFIFLISLFFSTCMYAQEYSFMGGLVREQSKKGGVRDYRGNGGYDSFIALNQFIKLDLNRKRLDYDGTIYRIMSENTTILKNGDKKIVVGLSYKNQPNKNLKATFIISNNMFSKYIFGDDDFSFEYRLDLIEFRR